MEINSFVQGAYTYKTSNINTKFLHKPSSLNLQNDTVCFGQNSNGDSKNHDLAFIWQQFEACLEPYLIDCYNNENISDLEEKAKEFYFNFDRVFKSDEQKINFFTTNFKPDDATNYAGTTPLNYIIDLELTEIIPEILNDPILQDKETREAMLFSDSKNNILWSAVNSGDSDSFATILDNCSLEEKKRMLLETKNEKGLTVEDYIKKHKYDTDTDIDIIDTERGLKECKKLRELLENTNCVVERIKEEEQKMSLAESTDEKIDIEKGIREIFELTDTKGHNVFLRAINKNPYGVDSALIDAATRFIKRNEQQHKPIIEKALQNIDICKFYWSTYLNFMSYCGVEACPQEY